MPASPVSMYDPQGTLRDVPFSALQDAVSNGGVPAHPVKAPDGTVRMVPVTRLKEAAENGGQIQPLESDEGHLPTAYGFTLGNLASNAWEGAKSVVKGAAALGSDIVNNPNWVQGPDSTLNKFVFKPADAEADKAKNLWNQGRYTEAVGHGLAAAVPLVGPAAAQLGEQAGTGDVGGALAKGAGMAAGGEALNLSAKLAQALPEGVSNIAKNPSLQAGVTAAAKKLPVAAIRRIPYVGDVAADVYKAGTEAAAKAQPFDATEANVPYAGEEAPPATRTVVTDPATGRPEFSDVLAARQPQAAPAAPVTPAKLEEVLNQATGGQPLVRGVSLRNQPAAQAVASGKLPEGFTPVDSSLLKGYKYDPEAQEFTAVLKNGQSYTHGEVTPEQVDAFEKADSQGAAWTKNIKQGAGTVLVAKNGKPVIAGTMQNAEGAIIPKAQAGAQAASVAPQSSFTNLEVPKGGVMTTADPAELTQRWGVDTKSLVSGREQTRGMSPEQTEQYVQKLTESYKNGQPVEPVLETRDAENNIVEVDGRARAIAAERAGVKRIPIMVRRMAPAKVTQ
jgi:hypothetical protein